MASAHTLPHRNQIHEDCCPQPKLCQGRPLGKNALTCIPQTLLTRLVHAMARSVNIIWELRGDTETDPF